MKITNDTLVGLLTPAVRRIPWDWAVYAGMILALLCAYVQSFGALSQRSAIVRDVVPLAAGIDIGALAVVFAASTIFASLMNRQFLDFVEDVDYLISIFAFSIVLLLLSAVTAFVLYLLSYATVFTMTATFFWICVSAEWLFFWAVLQIVDSFRIVSFQMLVVSRAPKSETPACCCCQAGTADRVK